MENKILNNNKYFVGAHILICISLLIAAFSVSTQCQSDMCTYSEYTLGFLLVPLSNLIYIVTILLLLITTAKHNTRLYESISLWHSDYTKFFILIFAISATTLSLHQHVFVTYFLLGPVWLSHYYLLLISASLYIVCSVFKLRRSTTTKISVANYLLVIVPFIAFIIFYVGPIIIIGISPFLEDLFDHVYYLYAYLVTVCTLVVTVYLGKKLNSK